MSNPERHVADLSPEERARLEEVLLRRAASRAGRQTIPRRQVAAPCPLSFAQQRLWFLDQLEPGTSTYNVPLAMRLQGSLDVGALERALGEIVARHEALRTTFEAPDGTPIQVIHEPAPFKLTMTDLSEWPAVEREAEARRLVDAEADRPFDLAHDLMLRASLLRLASDEHVLLLVMHHIASDGWSIGVFNRELAALYDAFAAGQRSQLPELPIQYADYALWQREWLQGNTLQEQVTYWRRQLEGAARLELPTDRPRPAGSTQHGARQTFELPAELVADSRALARGQSATLFMVLLAAFQTLLHRYSGQDDIVVGAPIAGRSRLELEGLIGFFANTLVLRTDLSGDPSFLELISRVREVALGAYAHQDLPFDKLVQELQPERSLGETPLFQTAFALQNAPGRPLELASLTQRRLETSRATAKFDVTMNLIAGAHGLVGTVEYSTELFDASTIAQLVARYRTLLEAVVADPECRLSVLRILPETERQQLLVAWNDTQSDYPRDQCFHQLFEAQVERTPGASALVFEGQQMTYGELNAQSNQVARYLRKRGVGPEVLVGICLERSPEMLVGLLGILKAGGAYVPLDPGYPRERLAYILQDAQVPLLLTRENLAQRLPAASAETVFVDTTWETIARESKENLDGKATPLNLAYVIYTSGSTGAPKGVMVTHSSLVNYLCWVNANLCMAVAYTLPTVTSLSFDASLKQLFAPLIRGDEVWLLSDHVALQPLALLSVLGDRTHVGLNCVPSLWSALLDLVSARHDAAWGSNLTCLFLGGAQVPQALIDRTFSMLPHLQVWNLYGPTEATANATAARLRAGDCVTIGRPIANTQVHILDADMQPVPVGVPGELYIGGAGLARGYLNRPDLTAEKFVHNPFSSGPAARLYKTGDQARYLPNGTIDLLGRFDEQVKIRGYRIELGEIEAALRGLPAVQDCAAIVREDTPGNRHLVAYVVFAGDQVPTLRQLRTWLRERLPEHMIPAVFVPLGALPLTPSGKVDRQALDTCSQPVLRQESTFVAPHTPVEETLAGIWSQLLGIGRIGVYDGFLELGGNSLLAAQLVARVREAFKVEVPIHSFLEAPNIAHLAETVELMEGANQRDALPPIVPIARDRPLALSLPQERVWFLSHLIPGNLAYNAQLTVRLKGNLNVAALNQALAEIVRRHEILRTSFPAVDGQPVQIVHPPYPVRIPVIDLSSLTEEEREAEAERRVAQECQHTFDVTRIPLVHWTLLRLDERDHVFIQVEHHLVHDGWSVGVFLRELWILYEAFSAGKPSPLPKLHIQFADYAAWQRQWVQGQVLEEQLAYWREKLADCPALLGLPTDHPRPAIPSLRGVKLVADLPAQLCESLRALSRQEGVTLFVTLLAAFKVLLHRYVGSEDIVVGSGVANRRLRETEGLIGMTVNTLVLRTDLSDDPSFSELLRRARQVTLEAHAHQDVPFDKVVEALHVEHTLGYNPLFQVMFSFHDSPIPDLDLPELKGTLRYRHNNSAKFDLNVIVIPRGEQRIGLKPSAEDARITVEWEYSTDLFNADTIARMAGNYETLLQGIVAGPERPISALPILREAERQVLSEWNDTRTDYPRGACIHELFEAQAARTPEAAALVFEDQAMSYGELNVRANRLAHWLQKRGVGPEVLVGICVERSFEMVVGLLGILKAGGAYLPLDPSYPEERLAFMLDDAGASILLTQERLRDRLAGRQVLCLDSDWPAIAPESPDNLPIATAADGLAYVIYTSGSTGQPKGVSVIHRGVVRLVVNTDYVDLGPDDVLLQFAPISFDASTFEVWGALLNGARLVIMPPSTASLDDLGPTIERGRVTVLWLTATLFNVMVDHHMESLKGLRLLLAGGEALSLPHVQKAVQALKGVQIINGYGPTENTTFTCCYPVPAEGCRGTSVPIGRPIANTQVYILDSSMRPVPIGVPGELYIGGDGLARGYLNRPELTADKFVCNPFSHVPGARLYRTGDRARWRGDGTVEFLGRLDQQVKIRGYRIEPGEIEAVLVRHPAVQEVAVVAREDTPGEKRLVAYVVADREQVLTASELRGFLRERLPQYMVPAAFVMLDALPLSPSKKVDRGALPVPERGRPEEVEAEPLISALPAGSASDGGIERRALESAVELCPDEMGAKDNQAYIAPRDDLELQLAGIWEMLLGVKHVGVRDNFFDLGGHSLLAVAMLAHVEKVTGRTVPVATLFSAPTIEDLAGILRQEGWTPPWSCLVPIQPGGSKPPLFCIHGPGGGVLHYRGLAGYLGSDQPLYGLLAVGLDRKEPPLTRVEDMAARYLKEIRSLQPQGPYFLAGQCFGGTVAFEIAQQLYAQGQQVALLALLDVGPRGYGRGLPAPQRLLGHMDRLKRMGLRDRLAYVLRTARNQGKKAERTVWRAAFEVYSRMGRAMPAAMSNVEAACILAARQHVPRPYPGRITLFWASDDSASFYERDPRAGWTELAAGGVEVHKVPGTHDTILAEPNVQVVAAEFKVCLERALGNVPDCRDVL